MRVWDEGDGILSRLGQTLADNSCSLGWLELHMTLAKLNWKMDLKLVSEEIDWHHDVQMHLLWKKPALLMKSALRSDVLEASTT